MSLPETSEEGMDFEEGEAVDRSILDALEVASAGIHVEVEDGKETRVVVEGERLALDEEKVASDLVDDVVDVVAGHDENEITRNWFCYSSE